MSAPLYCPLSVLLLHLLHTLHSSHSIVNLHQQSANMVIYMRRPSELGPRTWQAGIDCLEAWTPLFFTRRDHLTRSYNLVITSAMNMSTPAAQIQDGYLKLMNEAVRQPNSDWHKLFLLRTVYNGRPYVRYRMGDQAILYADYYVLITDSVERLRALMRDYVSRMSSWNPGARFLILFNNPQQRDMAEPIALEIFSELLYKYYVHRVGLLYATNDTDYSFLVLNYYNKVQCRTLRTLTIATCEAGQPHPSAFAVQRALTKFVKDITLDACTFRMCASVAAPFVEADCETGIEMRIIGFIMNRLKFQLNQTCQVENRGIREPNGSWTGLLGKLFDRDCDFILGGFYPDNEVIESFWTSDCYLSDSHTWFVKLADPRPAWIALYAIFKDETWLCFVLLLLVSWFFLWIFVRMLPEPPHYKEVSVAGINALAISICVSVNERPHCAASRIFFLALSLYGLNVTATYTSQLISVFTDPGYLHQIDNLNEVVEAGIPFGGLDENQDWFENDEDMWIFERYNDSELFEPNTKNLFAVKYGERVILTSRMFILQHSISDDVFAFPKNVFSSPLQMIMKAGFPMLTEFNSMIRSMSAHGIFQKIDKDFRYNNTYLNRIAKMRPEYKESVIVLTTDHLQGPFAVLIVGICSSLVFFVGELLVYWWLEPCWRRCCGAQRNDNTTDKAMQLEQDKAKLKRPGKQKKAQLKKDKERQKAQLKEDKERRRRVKKAEKRKASRARAKKSKQQDSIETDIDDIKIIQTIRFTPIKRRHIVLK